MRERERVRERMLLVCAKSATVVFFFFGAATISMTTPRIKTLSIYHKVINLKEPFLKGKAISTLDLLILANLYQLFLILLTLFAFLTK